ncbi:DCC1-like thiol-disulfide oxidoreductase family protein [Polaribacter cellanae]|uniref:DUF393 domain-containing protein n=1 Tax=Polaribacter cellanae TaxID=2818493 RepID=A0A975CNC8_9FLAO|nr:DCC1-like thiol-disulfide oxidoreductase family protein [Polaribacter cellanae]QTE21834.1 DUF393 domain-containing protein [Polaribacter cellanae]
MKKIIVFYDNWCPNCTRFINLVKKLDFFNLIDTRKLRLNSDISKLPDIDLELAKKQMASKINNKWFYGYNSIYHILIRLPIIILIFPFLYFFKITNIGQYLYVQLAIKRKIIPLHCSSKTCNIEN